MAQRSRPQPQPRIGSRSRTEDDEKRPEPEGRSDSAPAIDLPAEETFSVLRNTRRRTVVTYLAQDGEGGASVTEITRAVTAAEHHTPTEHVTDRQQKCVYVSLLQVHLPALVEKDVIEWDEATGTVERRESVGALAAMVDLVEWACDSEAN